MHIPAKRERHEGLVRLIGFGKQQQSRQRLVKVHTANAQRLVFASMALLLIALAGCSGGSGTTTASVTLKSQAPYATTSQTNVAYGPLPQESLTVCAPKDATGSRPGLVLIHGGGWSGGTSQEFAKVCDYMAQQGFVVTNIAYRLAPQAIWPAQIEDAQLAVRWLRAHAADYHLDTKRLCAWGSSAGAHMAVYLGMTTTIHPGDSASLLSDQSPNVNCVVDEFGPVDLTQMAQTDLQRTILLRFLGVSLAQNPAIYRDASPLFSVTPSSPPVYIIQGTRDTLVPPQESQELQVALQHASVPVTYVTYDGEHAFSGIPPAQMNQLRLSAAQFVINQLHP